MIRVHSQQASDVKNWPGRTKRKGELKEEDPSCPEIAIELRMIRKRRKDLMPPRESRVNPRMMTRRERSVLYLMAEGYKNREIADELYLSEETVRGTQVNLMRKWKASDVSSVLNHALEEGWISIYRVLESRFSKRDAQDNGVRT